MDEPMLSKGLKVGIYKNKEFIGKGIYLGSEKIMDENLESHWVKVFKLKGDIRINETECEWRILDDISNSAD